MAQTDFIQRFESIEKRLDRIEKRLHKAEKIEKLTLKEKFTLHECARDLHEWFEQVVITISDETLAKDLREITNRFLELIDKALGVRFP